MFYLNSCGTSFKRYNHVQLKQAQPICESESRIYFGHFKHYKNLKKTLVNFNDVNLLHFGSNAEEKDLQFKELAVQAGRYAKQRFQKLKKWVKSKAQENSEQKNAAISAGLGTAAGVTTDLLLTGGLISTVAAVGTGAATTAVAMKKMNKLKKEAPSTQAPTLPLSQGSQWIEDEH